MSHAGRCAADHALESDKRLVGSTCRCLFDCVGRVSGRHWFETIRSKFNGAALVDPAARAVDFSNVHLDSRQLVLNVAKSVFDQRLYASFDTRVAMDVIVTVELK
jgi:hypothetical protein